MKLFTTRTPLFTIPLALLYAIGLGTMFTSQTTADAPASVGVTQLGYSSGMIVMMLLATLSVTTEYRYNTIKVTFQAVPNRTAVILAKAAVVAGLSALTGLIGAFAAWGLGNAVRPNADLALNSHADWRTVAGVALVYTVAAILSVGVGLLVRHSAAGLAVILVYTLLLETVIGAIPGIGDDIQPWLPFKAANHFIAAGQAGMPDGPLGAADAAYPYGPWVGFALFAGVALVTFVAALIVTERRDA
jgi:ABC-2 type transport system permease protein